MTADELRQKLLAMDEDAKHKLKVRAAVGATVTDEHLVAAFLSEPAVERRVCAALDVPTEADRAGRASTEAARDARRCYVVSVAALVVAVAALLVALLVALFK